MQSVATETTLWCAFPHGLGALSDSNRFMIL